jgi:hypothetical protein
MLLNSPNEFLSVFGFLIKDLYRLEHLYNISKINSQNNK